MFSQPQTRYQAFGIHLLISVVIFIILAAIIIYIWYPGFLFWADGGWQGIRLIAGVDFILGPTLTLLVYKLGKPGLKFDLTMIGLVQIICLAIGCWLVYQERPLAIIYANGNFYTMSENSYNFYDYDSQGAIKYDDKIPAWIFVELPEDKQQRSQMLIKQLQEGPIHSRIDLYRNYKDNLDEILTSNIDPQRLDENTQNSLSENGKVYLFNARYSHSYIEIDDTTGEFIALHKKPKINRNNMKPLDLTTQDDSSKDINIQKDTSEKSDEY